VKTGFYETAKHCLSLSEPKQKCQAVFDFAKSVEQSAHEWDFNGPLDPIEAPGRPRRPELVEASRVPRRRLGSEAGRAALVHAIAHIEFNAINLALDAAYRFRDMPREYYRDWVSVASDEARHFQYFNSRYLPMEVGPHDVVLRRRRSAFSRPVVWRRR